MKKYFIVCLFFLSVAAYGQSLDLQLVVNTNAGVNGGAFWVDVQVQGVGLSAANTIKSSTIDITYDNTKLTYVSSTWNAGISGGVGYTRSVTNNTTYLRALITGGSVDPTSDPAYVGYDIGASWATWVTLKFTIVDQTKTTDHMWSTNLVSLFSTHSNSDGSGATLAPAATINSPTGLTAVPLPVELASFTASANRLNAQIKWSTATEKNNYGFEVERRSVESANAVWEKVGFVQGAGTSSSPKEYTYTDATASAGRFAYRLKQIDNDGGFKYSQSTEVEIGIAAKELALCSNYPNPFNPSTNIEFTVATSGRAILKVYNALGQEVAELFNGEAQAGKIIQTRFNASRLASGIYFSRLQADGKSLVKRMMLVK